MKRFLMKQRLITTMACYLLFCLFFIFAPLRLCERFSGVAYAAGSSNSYSIEWGESRTGRMAVVTWVWVADDTNATVPDSALSTTHAALLKYFFADMGETIPGAVTAPTALYDATLEDANGMDVFGGKLTNRSDPAKEQVLPAIGGALGSRAIHTGLTLKIANNSVNDATGTVIITFIK